MIDRALLKILACPVCRGDVKEEENQIICLQCGRQYPIRDGIPIMLANEAQKTKAQNE